MRFFFLLFFFSATLSRSHSLTCTIKPVDTDTQVSIEKVPINGVSVLSGLNFLTAKMEKKGFLSPRRKQAFRNNIRCPKSGAVDCTTLI